MGQGPAVFAMLTFLSRPAYTKTSIFTRHPYFRPLYGGVSSWSRERCVVRIANVLDLFCGSGLLEREVRLYVRISMARAHHQRDFCCPQTVAVWGKRGASGQETQAPRQEADSCHKEKILGGRKKGLKRCNNSALQVLYG